VTKVPRRPGWPAPSSATRLTNPSIAIRQRRRGLSQSPQPASAWGCKRPAATGRLGVAQPSRRPLWCRRERARPCLSPARYARQPERKVMTAGRDKRTRLRFSRISIARCADLVRSSASASGPLSQSVHPVRGVRTTDQRPCCKGLSARRLRQTAHLVRPLASVLCARRHLPPARCIRLGTWARGSFGRRAHQGHL